MRNAKEHLSEQVRNDIQNLKIVSEQFVVATSQLLKAVQLLDEMMEKAFEVFERLGNVGNDLSETNRPNEIIPFNSNTAQHSVKK